MGDVQPCHGGLQWHKALRGLNRSSRFTFNGIGTCRERRRARQMAGKRSSATSVRSTLSFRAYPDIADRRADDSLYSGSITYIPVSSDAQYWQVPMDSKSSSSAGWRLVDAVRQP